MKRQRGRNRGGGGGGGGKPQQQNANRAFDSNGPDGVKVRGNAQHVFEKYQQLARDAGGAGDRVLAENYLQHAEHYFRTLRAMQPQRPASEILGRDQFVSGFDLDFEDESGVPQVAEPEAEAEGGEAEGERGGGWQARDDRPDRQREDRQRDERPRGENRREGRWRDERPRDDRQRDERAREDRQRDDRPRGERPDPMAVVEPQNTPLPVSEDRAAAAPEVASPRRGAPRHASPVLRDAEGGESHAPAFLQNRAAEPVAEETERKPRRRRAPRSFEGGEGASPATEAEEV